MHRLIRILVFAPDADSALEAAHKVAHEQIRTADDGGPFDYFVDFTDSPMGDPRLKGEQAFAKYLSGPESKAQSLFGRGRWGSIPPVLQVNTSRFPTSDPRGMQQAEAAFELIREEFFFDMKWIRYHIGNYTDDELFREVEGKVEFNGIELQDDPGNFQSFCECLVGQNLEVGYLFDFKGRPITRLKQLQRILTDSDEHPYFVDESDGQDPNWNKSMWNQPLWIVPFDVHN